MFRSTYALLLFWRVFVTHECLRIEKKCTNHRVPWKYPFIVFYVSIKVLLSARYDAIQIILNALACFPIFCENSFIIIIQMLRLPRHYYVNSIVSETDSPKSNRFNSNNNQTQFHFIIRLNSALHIDELCRTSCLSLYNYFNCIFSFDFPYLLSCTPQLKTIFLFNFTSLLAVRQLSNSINIFNSTAAAENIEFSSRMRVSVMLLPVILLWKLHVVEHTEISYTHRDNGWGVHINAHAITEIRIMQKRVKLIWNRIPFFCSIVHLSAMNNFLIKILI